MPSTQSPASTVQPNLGPQPSGGGSASANAGLVAHINDTVGAHAASAISMTAGPAWADGTPNPASDVENQLDTIVAFLATGNGAAKIAYNGSSAGFADSSSLPISTLDAAVDSLVTKIGATASGIGNSGAEKLGVPVITNATVTIPAGKLSTQLSTLSLASGIQHEDFGVTFRNGDPLGADNVQQIIDQIVLEYNSALVGNSGARNIGCELRSTWLDGTSSGATSIFGAIDKIITDLNLQTVNLSGAQKIGIDARANWLDTTTNPANNIASAIKKIITDLNLQTSNASGANKIGIDTRSAWLDGLSNPATDISTAVKKIITDLSDSTGATSDGAARIGAATSGNLVSGTVRAQLNQLDTGWGQLSRANVWTETQQFDGQSSDTSAAIITEDIPSNFKLLWRMKASVANLYFRFYFSPFAFQIVTNASWTGTQWTSDLNGNACKYQFGDNATWVIQRKNSTVGVPWSDAAWDSTQTMSAITAEWQGDGAQAAYIGIEGRSDGSNNLGGSTNYRRKFSNTPSTYTFSVISQSNVASGPTDFANSIQGTGMFIGPTGAGQIYWFGTVLVS